uniref:Cystatin domain-containing protein n=1 Tax=Oreochromis niloticus TaxID=8128 RepID=A0A669F8A1_ORENI
MVALTVLAAVLAVGYGAMVGGFRDADVNDEGVQNALHFAVVQHNRGSNNMYLSQVAEVIKVHRKPSSKPSQLHMPAIIFLADIGNHLLGQCQCLFRH